MPLIELAHSSDILWPCYCPSVTSVIHIFICRCLLPATVSLVSTRLPCLLVARLKCTYARPSIGCLIVLQSNVERSDDKYSRVCHCCSCISSSHSGLSVHLLAIQQPFPFCFFLLACFCCDRFDLFTLCLRNRSIAIRCDAVCCWPERRRRNNSFQSHIPKAQAHDERRSDREKSSVVSQNQSTFIAYFLFSISSSSSSSTLSYSCQLLHKNLFFLLLLR